MEFLIGVALALLVCLAATGTGFDRNRIFYPVMLAVIAACYDLFAAFTGSARVLVLESLAMAAFIAAAIIGYRTSLWLVVAALAGHGLFDFVHGQLVANPGVPVWYPEFCFGYDAMAALYLAWRLTAAK